MNELIRELAKQTSYIWHASGTPIIYEFTPEKLEKFAELIVQECLEIVDEEGCGEGGSVRALVKIKEHFGVEE